MRIISHFLILSMVLQGFALSPAMANSDVCETDTFTPSAKTTDEIPAKCPASEGQDACKKTREAILTWNNDYKELAVKACKKRNESLQEIQELNQSNSYKEVAERAQAGIGDIQTLINANNKILEAIPKATENNLAVLRKISASRPTEVNASFRTSFKAIDTTFTRAKQKPELFEKEVITQQSKSGLSGASAQIGKDQLDTLHQSQQFAKALLLEKKKNEEAINELTQAKNNALKNQNKTETAGEDPNKSKESGFNPMSLLPLAAPLAGLLMQQKAQDSGLSDSMMPNPDLTAPPPSVAGTSFKEPNGSSQSPSPTPLGDSNKPDADMTNPGEPYVGGNEYVEPVGGDITNGDSQNRGALGAGGYSSNAGGGSSDSSGGSATGNKAERKPANAGPTNGEDTAIASGGGGLNFGGGAGSEEEPEGGMKDMLQDMEATLEDVPTGLFAEAEEHSSGSEIGAQDGDSLFPRVRACYVRNLKKGFVLNGLGERLPESESDQ